MEQTSPSRVRLLLFAICSYLVTIIAILIGLTSQFLYWLLFDSFGRHEERAKRKLHSINDQKDGEYYAIIFSSNEMDMLVGHGMQINIQVVHVMFHPIFILFHLNPILNGHIILVVNLK
jgi:hypothetical protein